jgi:hypothetical protein
VSTTTFKPPSDRKVPRYASFTQTVDVDVDVDAGDLHGAGWHHENECPAGAAPSGVSDCQGCVQLSGALADLHRQAHGTVPIITCRSEPCASLSFDQLRDAL